MKKPGVYIQEKNAFPNSVVEVASAVPAFIGYTEKATNLPRRITSMTEYISYFGEAPAAQFSIKPRQTPSQSSPDTEDVSLDIADYTITHSGTPYLLYHSMRLFFQNGGGPCYVISVGDYDAEIEADHFIHAIDLLLKEQEPTMIVMPDLMNLPQAEEVYQVQNYALDHCGDKMRNRVAILDIYGADKGDNDAVENFRQGMVSEYLGWGAAYYPWLNSTVVGKDQLSYRNIDKKSHSLFIQMLYQEVEQADLSEKKKAPIRDIIRNVEKSAGSRSLKEDSHDHKALILLSSIYRIILDVMHKQINRLPPSAAMAGLYTMVDNSRGVWKAPANVSVNSVISPALTISNHEIEGLNNPNSGKSVNAIRSFVGEGTLVWGARTLDGHSPEWRYINVRRTMIMLEQSIKLAVKAYVFETNNAATWVTIKGMIGNYLTNIWKRGGLAGATPKEAYSVRIGQGETMTAHDIAEGILRVSVLVAITRPAEFMEISISQRMHQS